MASLSIAMVEDDVDFAEEVSFFLEYQGMSVTLFETGEKLDAWLAEHRCDVLILDLNLPGESGLALAQRLAGRSDLRLVMLTARTTLHDRIAGFDAGADVYLTKPVDLPELVAVIKRLRKRLPEITAKLSLSLHLSQLITTEGKSVKLTQNEMRFLQALAQADDHYLTRGDLERIIWKDSDIYTSHRLEVLVNRLRNKLKINHNDLIKTHWREGYSLIESIFLI